MEGRRGKNDANDAAAVCEAASRPSMRFVPIKTAKQQGILAAHRLREAYKEERTACINRIRGLLNLVALRRHHSRRSSGQHRLTNGRARRQLSITELARWVRSPSSPTVPALMRRSTVRSRSSFTRSERTCLPSRRIDLARLAFTRQSLRKRK